MDAEKIAELKTVFATIEEIPKLIELLATAEERSDRTITVSGDHLRYLFKIRILTGKRSMARMDMLDVFEAIRPRFSQLRTWQRKELATMCHRMLQVYERAPKPEQVAEGTFLLTPHELLIAGRRTIVH